MARRTDNLREEFPLLVGSDIAYLDSAASTQKPKVVIQAQSVFQEQSYANVHRAIYDLASRATEAYEGARVSVAALIGAKYEELVFTRNATEALNMVALGYADRVQPGDAIVITRLEHHSNFLPWRMLAERRQANLFILPILENGQPDLETLRAVLSAERVKIVACAHVSNVLGTITPIAEIADLAHSAGALLVADGAQAPAHLPVDVRDLGVDAYAITAHKMYGPTGIGALYATPQLLSELSPIYYGGEMIESVDVNGKPSLQDPPHRFEAGTPPITEAIGFAAAADYLRGIGVAALQEHEARLTEELRAELEIPGVRVISSDCSAERVGVVSFQVDGVHPHDVAEFCNAAGVCVRSGWHCAEPLLRELVGAGVTRASLGAYSRSDDIRRLGEAVRKAQATLA